MDERTRLFGVNTIEIPSVPPKSVFESAFPETRKRDDVESDVLFVGFLLFVVRPLLSDLRCDSCL